MQTNTSNNIVIGNSVSTVNGFTPDLILPTLLSCNKGMVRAGGAKDG